MVLLTWRMAQSGFASTMQHRLQPSQAPYISRLNSRQYQRSVAFITANISCRLGFNVSPNHWQVAFFGPLIRERIATGKPLSPHHIRDLRESALALEYSGPLAVQARTPSDYHGGSCRPTTASIPPNVTLDANTSPNRRQQFQARTSLCTPEQERQRLGFLQSREQGSGFKAHAIVLRRRCHQRGGAS